MKINKVNLDFFTAKNAILESSCCDDKKKALLDILSKKFGVRIRFFKIEGEALAFVERNAYNGNKTPIEDFLKCYHTVHYYDLLTVFYNEEVYKRNFCFLPSIYSLLIDYIKECHFYDELLNYFDYYRYLIQAHFDEKNVQNEEILPFLFKHHKEIFMKNNEMKTHDIELKIAHTIMDIFKQEIVIKADLTIKYSPKIKQIASIIEFD